MRQRAWLLALIVLTYNWSADVAAEQMRRFGDWALHYVVVPSTFPNATIASSYGIVRARNRSFVNLSVLDGNDAPQTAQVDGTLKNLLGQTQALEFREIREGTAVYYIAEFAHEDQAVMRFSITVRATDRAPMVLEFQQKVHWEDGRAGRSR